MKLLSCKYAFRLVVADDNIVIIDIALFMNSENSSEVKVQVSFMCINSQKIIDKVFKKTAEKLR